MRPALAGAVAFSVGTLAYMLSCVIRFKNDHHVNFYPLMAVPFFFVAPVPYIMCGRSGPGEFVEEGGKISGKDVGMFLMSFFASSGLIVPLVLVHSGVISTGSTVLSSFGGGVITLAIVMFHNHLLGDSVDEWSGF